MNKFTSTFNFENIGKKIKNFAKWSCWIEIVLVWIGAVISFFVFVSDHYLNYLLWIPFVAAIFGPFIFWLSSWFLYGFGELIEKVTEIARNTNNGNTASPSYVQTATPFTPNTVSTTESVLQSPNIHKWNGKCQMCDKENVMVSAAVIVDDMGTRHRNVCEDCFKKHNCTPEKQKHI